MFDHVRHRLPTKKNITFVLNLSSSAISPKNIFVSASFLVRSMWIEVNVEMNLLLCSKLVPLDSYGVLPIN